jgi:hypothetical protein
MRFEEKLSNDWTLCNPVPTSAPITSGVVNINIDTHDKSAVPQYATKTLDIHSVFLGVKIINTVLISDRVSIGTFNQSGLFLFLIDHYIYDNTYPKKVGFLQCSSN